MALADNLVGYWKLDEASGNASDSSGNSNTLTNTGTVSYAAAKINNGASFDGTNRTLRITDASQTGLDITGNYTFQAWVNHNSLPGSGLAQGYAGKTVTGSRTYMWYLNNVAGSYKIAGYIGDGGAGTTSFNITWNTPNTATWYHIVVTYTASSGTAEAFVNGSSIGTAGSLSTSIGNGTSDFYIGDDGFGDYMNGLIDEVGIWTRVLSGTEITTLYNSGAGNQYPFVEGSSLRAFNLLGVGT